MESSVRSTLLSVPLKSNRVDNSSRAWSTALRTSCMSTSDTTSKLGTTRPPTSDEKNAVARLDPGRYPSGQRGRAVNPLRYRYVGSNPTRPTRAFLGRTRCGPGYPARGGASALEHLLHEDDVEPPAELAADLTL